MAFFRKIPRQYYGLTQLLTAHEMRRWESNIIEKENARGFAMMEVAGKSATDAILSQFPDFQKFAIFCGPGNNGGDGFVIARYLLNAEQMVECYSTVPVDSLKGDAARMANLLLESGTAIHSIEPSEIPDIDHFLSFSTDVCIIDALLGTGLERPLEGIIQSLVDIFNRARCPVASIDIPTGVNADTGTLCGSAVKADLTVTFGIAKRGLFLGAGRCCAGKVVCIDIGLRPDPGIKPGLLLTDTWKDRLMLPERPLDLYKNLAGHVLILGGSEGMSGAAWLAGRAAYRAGCGLVSVGFAQNAVPSGNFCEIMAQNITENDNLNMPAVKALIERANVIACGPGLGRSQAAIELIQLLSAFKAPLVLDADALWLLARRAETATPFQTSLLVLTPHIGEAATLLHCEKSHIVEDPVGSACEIARKYQSIVVLKSHTTVICTPDEFYAIQPLTNPNISTGGTGDVLCGTISSILAQSHLGLSPFLACCYAVWLHAHAGRLASEIHHEGTIAGDLIEFL